MSDALSSRSVPPISAPQGAEAPAAALRDVFLLAMAHQQANQHWLAIGLLEGERWRDDPEVRRLLAAALGGKAELALRWADALAVPVGGPLLNGIERDLLDAVAADPTLPDPHWDLAVVAARFRGDYDASARHLATARELGLDHPLLPRLEQLLAVRPPLAVPTQRAVDRLRELVLELALQACGPLGDRLRDDAETRPGHVAGGYADRRFGEYLEAALAVAAGPDVGVDDLLDVLHDGQAVTGDAAEVVADLLRRVAEARAGRDAADSRFLDLATSRHIELLVAMTHHHVGMARESGDATWARRAVRAAGRAREVADASPAQLPPDLRADVLLAEGTALYAREQRDVALVTRRYREALQLKREAGNEADVARLVDLLWRQIDARVGRALAATVGVGGVGQALDALAELTEAADELDDPQRALRVRLHLGTVQRAVGLYEEAEANLRRVVAESVERSVVADAEHELASLLSESGRPAEAAQLQERLLREEERRSATLWSNYANSLRLLGRLADARTALQRAWELLPSEQRERQGSRVPTEGARVAVVRAEVEHLLGDLDQAASWLRVADGLDMPPFGGQALHWHSIRASVLLALGRTAEAWESLDRADAARRSLLANGPSYATWESLLRQWHHLDARIVRALLDQDHADQALVRAEAAKGRVTAWLAQALDRDGAAHALDPERVERALEEARQWAGGAPGRVLVSLFAGNEGLAVFRLHGSGSVQGTWVEEVRYERFREDVYEPWVAQLERALAADDDDDLREAAGRATLDLLDELGHWLDRAVPDLAAGGSELVLVPHRLFRNVPLAHARLPGGARLGDVFDSVVTAPTLAHLGPEALGRTGDAGRQERWALADADGSLPFARCEALLAAPPRQVRLGPAATRVEALDVLRRAGTVLLSVHGQFDAERPLESEVVLADGALRAMDLLGPERRVTAAVLLGACETGRSRRSVSDEPWSFPTLLLQAGSPAVVAPLWPVDDLAAFLFGTTVVEELDGGATPGAAVGSACRWLRQATAPEVLDRLDGLLRRVDGAGAEARAAASAVRNEVDQVCRWLSGLGRDVRPYDDPLDWAAFQAAVGGGEP